MGKNTHRFTNSSDVAEEITTLQKKNKTLEGLRDSFSGRYRLDKAELMMSEIAENVDQIAALKQLRDRLVREEAVYHKS